MIRQMKNLIRTLYPKPSKNSKVNPDWIPPASVSAKHGYQPTGTLSTSPPNMGSSVQPAVAITVEIKLKEV